VPKTKLQWQKTSEKKGIEYGKYTIVLPKNAVEQLQWAKGDVLVASVDGKTLKIKKAR
jgi:hypothetical protein